MNFLKLKRELIKQEMLLRSYIGYSETNLDFSKIQSEIVRLVSIQKEIDSMTESELLSDVPVHYEVIQSNFTS